jgi:hypothetical protein
LPDVCLPDSPWHPETGDAAASLLDPVVESKIKQFLGGIAENTESLSREVLKAFLTF